VSFVVILVIVFLIFNLLVDLLYAVLDPRIRYA
jgi:oligopeptide transport system permease protein